MISRKPSIVLASLLVAFAPASLRAQENYEIQVYPSETMPKGVTMFELHSNYTREPYYADARTQADGWLTGRLYA